MISRIVTRQYHIPRFWFIAKIQELELDKFITLEVDLKDINKAFDLLLQGKM